MDGVPTGLDYLRVEAAARLAGIEMTKQLFSDLQAMESAALDVWIARRRRESANRRAGKGR